MQPTQQYASIQSGTSHIHTSAGEPSGDISRQIESLKKEVDMLEGVATKLMGRVGPVLSLPEVVAPTAPLDGALVPDPVPPTTAVGGEIKSVQERLSLIRRELIDTASRVSI